MRKLNPNAQSLFYRVFKIYVKLITDGLYYRKVYVVGRENVPDSGHPAIIVSNHQNCLNDPLTLATTFTDRKPRFLTRANVFQWSITNRFLRHLGLLPVYRMEYEGKAALPNNYKTFDEATDAMINGGTVVLYPERGHQDKRWLGNFFIGYLKMGFEAAEKSGFTQDIQVIPSCNHYSNYHHMQSEVMIRFGEPVSLMPYYDSYRKDPRGTMREVNQIVKERVSSLMLNISDVDNYAAIDFIRESRYGGRFCSARGLSTETLPDRLEADKRLVAELADAKQRDDVTVEGIFRDALVLRDSYESLKIRDWLFDRMPTRMHLVLRYVALVLLFPIFAVSAIPNLIVFFLPEYFKTRLLKDHMFFSSFNVGVSVFITIPLLYILPFIILLCVTKYYYALAYLVLCPLLLVFDWYYIRMFTKSRGAFRFRLGRNRSRIAELKELRESLFARLDTVLGIGRD